MTVSLTQAKAQLRVRHSEQDTYITDLIARAKAWVERFTALVTEETEVEDTFTEFGDYLLLTRSPVVDLIEIAYTDTAGDPQTVADARLQGGKVYPPTDGWPSILDYSNITATYDAGYGGYNPTPPELDAAMLLLIEHWFYPDNDATLDEIHDVPCAVVSLAGPFRIPTVS